MGTQFLDLAHQPEDENAMMMQRQTKNAKSSAESKRGTGAARNACKANLVLRSL